MMSVMGNKMFHPRTKRIKMAMNYLKDLTKIISFEKEKIKSIKWIFYEETDHLENKNNL